jgi:hypothetical protein
LGESNAVFALACRRFGCSENLCGIDWLCSKNDTNSYLNFFLYPMHSSAEMWHQLRVSKARSHLVSHVDRLANFSWVDLHPSRDHPPSHPSNTPDHPTRSHALGGPIEYSASVPENGYRRHFAPNIVVICASYPFERENISLVDTRIGVKLQPTPVDSRQDEVNKTLIVQQTSCH